jgi:ribose-phosphate pyrophosphokinase
MKFPSGEIQVKLDVDSITEKDTLDHDEFFIKGSILNSAHFFELAQLVEVLRSTYLNFTLYFVMPYCAYSRQDRVCNEGESFSLKVFSKLLNSLNIDRIQTWDNHSDVSSALLDNCTNIPVNELLTSLPALSITYDFFISPDAGANKKVQACSKQFNIPMLRADKIRDTATGRISDTIIYATPEQLNNSHVLIIDDLCDGGKTFTELANAIHSISPTCKVDLYITHGFFSKGIEPLIESGINHIFTTDSVCTISHRNLTVLD